MKRTDLFPASIFLFAVLFLSYTAVPAPAATVTTKVTQAIPATVMPVEAPLPAKGETLLIYDGDTPASDLNRANGGPYYEMWWAKAGDNSLVDTATDPHSGKKCAQWTCAGGWSGGALMVDPGWSGLNIETATNLEFWMKGAKGGETVTLEFFDKLLGKPTEKDGHFNPLVIKNIPAVWTKYSFPLIELTNKHIGKTRGPDLGIFEGFMISGAPGGTTVFLDDMKWNMKPRVEKQYAAIKINRIGWRPADTKIAIINRKSAQFGVIDAKLKKQVFTGQPVLDTESDPSSGDAVWHADFSGLKTPGTYFIQLDDKTRSPDFTIGDDVYVGLWKKEMKVFYVQRCGIPLLRQFVTIGQTTYTQGPDIMRMRCHPSDTNCGYAMRLDGKQFPGVIDVTGGWHDAGDDNKYSNPIYSTVWYLVQAYLENPARFPDNLGNIPESGNGRSDLVDEILWETAWYHKMQVKSGPEAGLVYNKVGAAGKRSENKNYLLYKRWLYQPTSNDTIIFCGLMAAVSSMLETTQKDADSLAKAKLYREDAVKAWEAYQKATKNGKIQVPKGGYKNPKDWDGSTAMGNDLNGEIKMAFNAAVELYRLTKEARFGDYVKSHIDGYLKIFLSRDQNWGTDEFLAFYVYSTLPKEMIDAPTLKKMQDTMLAFKGRVMEYVKANAYRVPFGSDGHFCWGSNSHLLKNCANFWFLYKWFGKQEDLELAKRGVDYVMGLNAVDKIMFTGYDETLMYHGIWSTMSPAEQPVGYLVGGVDWGDNRWMSRYPQKCYRDSTYNWSVNEGAIYYQAAAVFMTSLFVP